MSTLLLLLFAGFFLPVSVQSQKLESLTATAKGHGLITSAIDELEITSALVVLRENGTVLIVIYADLQLQAEGTWKASASSPEEILLKITGGVLKGEMTGPGKLLLTSDRKSFEELTINVKLSRWPARSRSHSSPMLPNPRSRGYERWGHSLETRLGLPASTLESGVEVHGYNRLATALLEGLHPMISS